jgi:F-type H+-transporting ATPase subunit b
MLILEKLRSQLLVGLCLTTLFATVLPSVALGADDPAEVEGEDVLAEPTKQAHVHDPYDLTHAGGSTEMENPAAFAVDMALYSFVVFLILVGILWMFAWGPITKALDAREEGILAKINDATAASEKAQATLAEYQAKLDAGAEEVREMLAEARRDAEATKARITADAEAVAAKERQRAIDDIHRAKEGALQELAELSATQAVELAQGIVGRQITGEDHSRLVQEAVERLPSSN